MPAVRAEPTPTSVTASGDIAAAAGDFVHNDGYITGQFSFAGNLYINSGSDGGSGTLTANGTGAQTYSVSSGAPRTCATGINKTSGTLSPASGVTDFYIQGFNQTLGNFTAPTGSLSIGGTRSSNTILFKHSAGTFSHNNGIVILRALF